MDDHQEDKRSMYQAVRTHLGTNQAIWSGVPAFVTAEAAFRGEVTNIQSLAQDQQQPSTGVTSAKQQLRGTMADAAMPIVGPLKALAAVTQDTELAADSDFTRSDFIYGRDTVGADNADKIHGLAAARVTELANYSVTQQQVDDLRSAIDAYRDSIGRPRQVIGTKAAATEQLEAAFVRADAVLNEQLDNLVEIFRLSQPAFYLGYQNARQIIDGGGSDNSPPSPSSST